MVIKNISNCPNCGGALRHYDSVSRLVRTIKGIKNRIKIRRLKCVDCNKLHRELPENLLPYKHYEADIIKGVREGHISSETLGYEDYPCSMTMLRWLARI